MFKAMIHTDLTVSAARQALIAAGGSIDEAMRLVDCPTPEAAAAGVDYLAALHRHRQNEAELADSRRYVTRYVDSLVD